MDEDRRAGVPGHVGLGKTGLPTVVRVERKRGDPYPLERGQMLEERVRRRGHENRVAGIAEELEQKPVRFATASRALRIPLGSGR